MGIYVYEARALEYLPAGPCQFPELVLRLLEAGERVAAYRRTWTGTTSGRSTSTSARWPTWIRSEESWLDPRADHRDHGSGRVVSRRAPARAGLRGARARPGGGRRAPNIAHIADRLTLHTGDLADRDSLAAALATARPSEVYNLAAVSSVAASWEDPALTGDTNGLGVARLLEAVRTTCPEARLFHASSNEIFGPGGTADEQTPLVPRTPYGAAKAYAHHLVIGFREAYGLFCCNGILFNHESPRRGLRFVTRKITHGAAAIKLGKADELRLGTLEAQRDWGYAPDYVAAMWRCSSASGPRTTCSPPAGRARSATARRSRSSTSGSTTASFVKLDDAFARPAEAEPLRRRRGQGETRARLGAAHRLRGDDRPDGRPRPGDAPRVSSFWHGRRVLVTGHTGFKGAWLALWLHRLGAEVTGFSAVPPTAPSLFEAARVGELVDDVRGDVRDAGRGR